MHRAMEQMIRRYGSNLVLIHQGQAHSVRAFLQETRSRNKESVRREFTPLGEIPRGMHVYIGPVVPEAAVGDLILLGDRSFEVRRAEPVLVGDEKAYCWGICVEMGGDGQWSS